jgi:hypothetical protein
MRGGTEVQVFHCLQFSPQFLGMIFEELAVDDVEFQRELLDAIGTLFLRIEKEATIAKIRDVFDKVGGLDWLAMETLEDANADIARRIVEEFGLAPPAECGELE